MSDESRVHVRVQRKSSAHAYSVAGRQDFVSVRRE